VWETRRGVIFVGEAPPGLGAHLEGIKGQKKQGRREDDPQNRPLPPGGKTTKEEA